MWEGRQLLFWLVLFVNCRLWSYPWTRWREAWQSGQRQTNRHAHHYLLCHWPLPGCWYFLINLICYNFVFFLKYKSLTALTYRTAKNHINWQGSSFIFDTGNKSRSPKSDLLNKMSGYDSLRHVEFTDAERGGSSSFFRSCPSFSTAGCTSSFYLVLALPFIESRDESLK